MIKPLKPQLARGTWADVILLHGLDAPAAHYPLMKELGAAYEVVIGFLWGTPQENWKGYFTGIQRFPPYEDFKAFENFVTGIAEKVKALGLTQNEFVFEVWNEPDGKTFWPNADQPSFRQKFFETYRVAERAIHKILPDHKVAGPSWSFYKKEDLRGFLNFCLENGCEVNVLSWHEIFLRPFKGTAEVEQHVGEMRREFLENPKYAALKLKEIHINEMGDAPEQYWPAEALAYFSALELGGADRASRSCWGSLPDIYGSDLDHCGNGSLGGLLQPKTFKPRAIWWAYRAYAAGVEMRAESHSSHPGIVSLASLNGLKEGLPQVLVGHVRMPLDKELNKHRKEMNRLKLIPETQTAIPVAIEVRGLESVPQLANAEQIRAHIYRIPHTLEAPLSEPESVEEIKAAVIDGTATLKIKKPLGYQEVFVVELFK